MNPHFALRPFEDNGPPTPLDHHRLSAWLATQERAAWREVLAVPRGDLPPVDRSQWAAWALGEATTGPRRVIA